MITFKFIHILIMLVLLEQIFFLTNPYAQTNDVRFEHISIEHGLPHVTVYSILQDTKGFMWFGTQDGFCKYDGYNMTPFKHDPSNLNSLSEKDISCIYEDKSGIIWIGTWGGGLNKFDPNVEEFKHYKNNPDNPNSLADNRVQIIYEDLQGNLWIGTSNGGLGKFDRKTEQFKHYKHEPENPYSINNNRIWAICEDDSENLWIGTDKGLSKFSKGRGDQQVVFTHYKYEPISEKSEHNVVRCIYIDKSQMLWIGTQNGLDKFNPQTKEFEHFVNDTDNPNSISHNIINCIYEDRSGTIWIGTRGGLNRYNRQTGKFTRFLNDLKNPYSISHNDIRVIYEDKSEILWIGTRGGGINKLDRKPKKFSHIAYNPNMPDGLNHPFVLSICEDRNGMLWIGTDAGGLNKLDRKRNKWTYYKYNPHSPQSGPASNRVGVIYEDPDEDILWIGTENGLDKFDIKKEKFTNYKNESKNANSLSDNSITWICKDKSGFIWIGTFAGGVNRFDPKKETFTHYKHNPDNKNSLSGNQISIIYEDYEGTLWIGTSGRGLSKLDKEKSKDTINGIFTHYKNEPNNINSLSDNRILSIYEDPSLSGIMWIGTSNGLNKFNRLTGNFTHYFEKDGLPNSVINSILQDNKGNLWFSTNKGLSKFNTRTDDSPSRLNKFRNYDVNDGLQSNKFNRARYKNKNGEMFFGGINGFNSFYPDSVKDNSHIPQIALINFKKFDKTVKFSKSIFAIDKIELSYRDNFFSFEFSVLDYTKSEKNQYAYKLEGFDKDWVYSGNRRYATYTNLDPGKYIFRVKGSNNDGIWNEEGTSVKIIITPPFWKTWWFRIFTVISILGLAFLGYKIRVKSIEARNKMLEIQVEDRTRQLKQKTEDLEKKNEELRLADEKIREADKLKSQFLARMSHELRTPLNAIIGFSELMLSKIPGEVNKEQQECLTDILESGRHLLQLINDILDLSKIEAGKMELYFEAFNLNFVLDSVQRTMTPLFDKKKQKFEIKVNENLPEIYADKGKIKQVIINLLSNANKYTQEGGVITLGATESNGCVEIYVSDTGRGIKEEDMAILFDEFRQFGAPGARGEQGTGLGLALCKRFIEMQNGKIWVESKYGHGSTFTFAIPISKTEVSTITSEKVIPEVIPKVIPVVIPEIADKQKNILVIEDDEKASKLLRYYLEQEGYSVFVASNGNDAIELARKVHPKVITLDILLPRKDGWEILRELKIDPATEKIPVIIVSMLDDKNLGYSLDADDYFVKPVDKNKLLQRISELSLAKSKELSETILIIDDDLKYVKLISSILENYGYRTLKAHNGKEGIELARKEKPRLILLDLLMPEMTGFEVVNELKNDNNTKDIPVVILTVKDLTKKDTEILDGHIKQLMTKTRFNKHDLIDEIKKYL